MDERTKRTSNPLEHATLPPSYASGRIDGSNPIRPPWTNCDNSARLPARSRILREAGATLNTGARARAHRHDAHESAAYVIEGAMLMWFGEQLEHKLVARAGDFVYIPNGIPHLVLNAIDCEPAVAVLARADPNEQEDVTALPELDALPHLATASPR